jgi:hypothetical protein
MPIEVSCECGRTLRAKDEAAGRKVRCPACGAIIEVPAELEEVGDDTYDPPPVQAPREKPRRPERVTTEESDDAVRRRPSEEDDNPEPPSRPPRRKRPKRRAKPESDGVNIGVASIITGAAMMLGAVVWFIAGLAFGYIFFYPPILFLLGIAAIVRGFMGKE